MNKCHFVGMLADDPHLVNINNTYLVTFTLAIEDHRKDKDGSKKRRVDFLRFEAWATGAQTIDKHAYKGDFMAVESIARQSTSHQEKKSDTITFRVTNFKIFNNNKLNEDDEK